MTTEHESETVIDAFERLYPQLDSSKLYCLFTGAPVCEIDEYDSYTLFGLLEGTAEEQAQQLAMRILSASRPSILFNMMNTATLDRLRKSRPAMTLAYLEGGARGLDKNKSGFFEMMLARIERFQVIRDMDEEQLESAFFNYHLEAARKEEEETRAARLMRNWLENTTPVGRQAAHRRVIENLESMADAMRLKKASKALSETQRKKLEKSRFLDGLIEELWADHETLPAVDTVLTHAPKPLGKPAFRIAMPRKDS